MKMQWDDVPSGIVVSKGRNLGAEIPGSIEDSRLALLRHSLAQYRKRAISARPKLGSSEIEKRKGEHVNRLHNWLCRSGRWRKTVERRVPWVLSGSNLGSNVLELGPGPGLTTDLLHGSVPRLTALELDSGLAESLNSRFRGSNVEVVTGDATAMPFSDAKFSGGVSFTMLHHVPSPELQDKLLCEVLRVIKPGAEFVGSDSLQSLFMRLIHIGDTLVPINPDTFGLRLEAAGFQVLQIEKNDDAFRFHARKPVAR